MFFFIYVIFRFHWIQGENKQPVQHTLVDFIRDLPKQYNLNIVSQCFCQQTMMAHIFCFSKFCSSISPTLLHISLDYIRTVKSWGKISQHKNQLCKWTKQTHLLRLQIQGFRHSNTHYGIILYEESCCDPVDWANMLVVAKLGKSFKNPLTRKEVQLEWRWSGKQKSIKKNQSKSNPCQGHIWDF